MTEYIEYIDPFPHLRGIMKVDDAADVGMTDYRKSKWDHTRFGGDVESPSAKLTSYRRIYLHHGGGPNKAGNIEFPEGTTFRERLLYALPIEGEVYRGWERFHVLYRAWRGIAYNGGIGAFSGRLTVFRGFRNNGAQSGHWNSEGLAFVASCGIGQYMRKRAWETLGLVWFLSGGPPVWTHRDTNFDSPPEHQTSCAGDVRQRKVHDDRYIKALKTLKWSRFLPRRSKGRQVRAVTKVLVKLGRLDQEYDVYRQPVMVAVTKFQQAFGLPRTGRVDIETWRALAAAWRQANHAH